MTEILAKNIAFLKQTSPQLADLLEQHEPRSEFTLEASKEGPNTLLCQGTCMHSTYNPVREGEQLFQRNLESAENGNISILGEELYGQEELAAGITSLKVDLLEQKRPPESKKIVFLGNGLGYQVLAAIKAGYSGYWVEPSRDFFALAARSLDLSEVLPHFTPVVEGHPFTAYNRIAEAEKERIGEFRLIPFNLMTAEQQNFFSRFVAKFNYEGINRSYRMRILVVSPIYGGSLTTYRYSVEALRNIGHEVIEMDTSIFEKTWKDFQEVTSNKAAGEILRSRFVENISEAIVAKIDDVRPNLVIALAQAPINGNAFERIKKMNVPVAFWFVEDFRTLRYWVNMARHYDYFFTIQRGEFFSYLRHMGINYYYLPSACLPSFHKKVALTEEEKKEFGSDLSFVGAGYYNRQILLKRLLDYDFKIWGTAWEPNSPLWKNVQRNGAWIDIETTLKIFNASKVNLNLHSSTYHKGINLQGDFINPRTYEIASAGCFQLVDKRKLLHESFEIGKEIETFSTMDELREKIDFYLQNAEGAGEIAEAGQQRARLEHSYEERLKEMIAVVAISRPETVKASHVIAQEKLVEQAGIDTELGKYLASIEYKGGKIIKPIMAKIAAKEGNLSRLEKIMLLVHENIK